MIYIGPRIAVHFSEQYSDQCWDTRRVHNNEELGKKLKFELSQKFPPKKMFTYRILHKGSHCFIMVVWYCFLVLLPKYEHTNQFFFKRAFHKLDIQIIFSFRNMSTHFSGTNLTDPGNCFVNLALLPFSLPQNRLFHCQSPRGQKAHLSGTKLPGFQACTLDHPCSHNILCDDNSLMLWKDLGGPQAQENSELLQAVVFSADTKF